MVDSVRPEVSNLVPLKGRYARRAVWGLPLVGAVATIAVATAVSSPAAPGGSEAVTIDRTWSCPLRGISGYRLAQISAAPAGSGMDAAIVDVSDDLAPGPESGLVSIEEGPNRWASNREDRDQQTLRRG
jgi:hypothetical protein